MTGSWCRFAFANQYELLCPMIIKYSCVKLSMRNQPLIERYLLLVVDSCACVMMQQFVKNNIDLWLTESVTTHTHV